MSLTLQRARSSTDIATALRAEICAGRAGALLHEGELAERFGVSRTPVRQALQRLAYERMVTVKSGVGTMVVRLQPEQRDDDIAVAAALLDAAAACAGPAPLPARATLTFAGFGGMLDQRPALGAEEYFELRARLLAALVELIPSEILADAYRAAGWRLIRWRMAAVAEDAAAETDALRRLLDAAGAGLESGTAAALFTALARAERAG
ncbi:regulatory protein GntR, HTH:GntR, C-terminal [Oceanicola granulosus HTCC2516]|uniref:Regulatory protein GntR, HTH:GntR, C-terminal n=1 Tax=Oceanicola granulosus (strain ATCC BAA-861 / DSM 15982 / KCTC 12143 / HTCC2516) TaxID=314256 RepID=Q2CBU3_OCEGH|nr:GntR family transcriptional regulator [Oceanicola granulosus]EAR50111.1 regulatory protein GntR, HTH:GntR, C-terminal [Oceanicola granulosus HTCC2516]